MKLIVRILKNRIRPVVMTQFILFFPLIVFTYLTFTKSPVNFFYFGFIQIIVALMMLLMAIEQFVLKKKGWSIFFFIISIFSILVAVNSFYVSTLSG